MYLNRKSISKSKKRKVVLEYITKIYKNENRFVSKREIRKVFHVELYNYFKNMFEMYQQISIDIPLCFCPRDYAKKKIVEYVKEKANEMKYPGRLEIDKVFGINIYTYFASMKNLYKTAKINYQLHMEKVKLDNFHSTEKIQVQRKKIINYI